ncbi:MAG: hypothetical protein VX589_02945, partial [Myxococcota bacterium]|nr:hypothetical protein [Myxococcota bacterium]
QKLAIKLSAQTVFLTVRPVDGPTDEAIRKAVKAAGYDVSNILRPSSPSTPIPTPMKGETAKPEGA